MRRCHCGCDSVIKIILQILIYYTQRIIAWDILIGLDLFCSHPLQTRPLIFVNFMNEMNLAKW